MLELRLAGETLNEDTKEMLLRDAENYGIMRSQIVIHEDATVQVDRFNETEIVKNLMATNASNVQMRDDSIKVLNAQIAAYKQQELPAVQLAAELQIQLPTITRVALAKGTALEQNVVTSEQLVVVIVHCSEMPSEEERARVYEWLKVRLQVQDLEIIFDYEEMQVE
jgi:hypothetical protein